MRYGLALKYFAFKPRTGLGNLGYGTLCLLSTIVIPVVGQIVLLGYFAEVAEDLDEEPDGRHYYDFTFDRFLKYLSRGVYPFLAQLLVGLLAFAGYFVAIAAGVLVWLATDLPAAGVAVGLLVLGLAFVGVMVVYWPVTLHAQLSRGIDFGANWAFTRDFLGRVGWDVFGTALAFVPIAFGLTILGAMACYFGLFPAMVILVAAQEHLMIQLYHRYLDAGGEPVRRAN